MMLVPRPQWAVLASHNVLHFCVQTQANASIEINDTASLIILWKESSLLLLIPVA